MLQVTQQGLGRARLCAVRPTPKPRPSPLVTALNIEYAPCKAVPKCQQMPLRPAPQGPVALGGRGWPLL